MSKVVTSHLASLVPLFDKLEALTADEPRDWYVDGDLPIYHSDGWLIGVAVFEDDQWWIDFTNYGADAPSANGRPT